MHVESAMLPDARSSQDRIFVTSSAVIVLDGATAFVPVHVASDLYVDTLGRGLIEALTKEPANTLSDSLAQAIEQTARQLELQPGRSPSSTAAIVRQKGETVDYLVLGDTQIATADAVIVDDRIAEVAPAERAHYRERLANGGGYDETHRVNLRALQTEQAKHRNQPDGYWIAEADPRAAMHAMTGTLTSPWAVLASDGAFRVMTHLGLDDWATVAGQNSEELSNLLATLGRWEAQADPNGNHLPRAKRHDDKTIAAISFS